MLYTLGGRGAGAMTFMRPFCLVKSRSQDAAANAGVLSVYLTTILYHRHQLFIDFVRDTLCPFTVFYCQSYLLWLTCIIMIWALDHISDLYRFAIRILVHYMNGPTNHKTDAIQLLESKKSLSDFSAFKASD